MYTKEQTKSGIEQAYKRLEKATVEFDKFPKLPNGAHAQAIKDLPEFKIASEEIRASFANVQIYNKYARTNFPKEFKEGFFRS